MRRAICAAAVLSLATGATALAQRSQPDAQALARAVNLTKADMRGYKARPAVLDELSADAEFVRCSKTVPIAQTVALVPSKSFQRQTVRGYQSVSSEVIVRPDAALAAQDLKAYGTSRTRRCIAKYVRRQVGRDLLRVSVKPFSPPVRGGNGIRIVSLVRSGNQRGTYYIDLLTISHEDVEAALIVSGGPAPPLTRPRENKLLKLIESRVRAQLQAGSG